MHKNWKIVAQTYLNTHGKTDVQYTKNKVTASYNSSSESPE